MRAPALTALTALLLMSVLHIDAGGRSSDGILPTTPYDAEYGDLIIGPTEVVSFTGMNVLVKGKLDVQGTLELTGSVMTLSNEGPATHSVVGILRLSDLEGTGVGSTLQAVGGPGSASVNMFSGTLQCINSTLGNITIHEGDISITGSTLSNCTLNRPWLISHLAKNCFSGVKDRVAINLNSKSWELSHNTFLGYGTALRSEGGSLKVSSSVIKDCMRAFESTGTEGDGELRLEKLDVSGSNVSISSWGTLTIEGSHFTRGSMELRGKPIYIRSSYFTDHDGILGATEGVVTGCTFQNCTVGLNAPLRTKVVTNRFLSCWTAVQDDRDCELYHNTFLGNQRVVEGFVQSVWYNSSLKEGNHYDIYKGSDNGASGRQRDDGIGDTELPFLGRDYYPLLKDNYWLFPRIPTLSAFYQDGGSEVSLSWDHKKDIYYIVQCSMLTDFSKLAAIYSASASPLKVKVPGNGTFHYRIGAWNEMGCRGWSVPSSVLVDQLPVPPHLLSAEPVPEGEGVTLTWEWEGEDIFGGTVHYTLGEGDETTEPVQYPSMTVIIGGLKNGRTYTFSMSAVDNRGQPSRMGNEIRAMPMDTVPPPPPSSVTATPLNNSAIAVQWNPPSDLYYPDLSGFLLYRKGPEDSEMQLIKSFNRGVLYYEDRGLKDNSTYHYNLRSVDDDGPVSAPSDTVHARTHHYNAAPIFIWDKEVIDLVEDGPITVLDVSRMFLDPDGDRTFVSVVDSFPFASEVKGGALYLYQEKDQSGNGYVQLLVTDGEAFEMFLIGIYIEPREDAPRDLTIISPVNGSVLLPGSLALLEGYAFDPDTLFEGDILTFRWSSDRDGVLSGPGLSVSRMRAPLSPGPHLLELTVTDSTGNTASASVRVMVSLWGWGELPWRIEMDNSTEPLTTPGGVVRLLIVNDGPIFLTFDCTVTLRWGGAQNVTVTRSVMSPPMDRGLMVVNVPEGIPAGKSTILLSVNAFTLNGTFAGYRDAAFSIEVREVAESVKDYLPYLVLGGAGLLVLVLAASYVVFQLIGRKSVGKRPYGAEDVRAGTYDEGR